MIFYLALAAGLTAADQLIKYWAVHVLKGNAPISVIDGFFRFRYLENDGAAFSMLRGKQLFFVFITIAAFIVLAYMLKTGMIKGRIGYWSVALVAGGAIGNFIDRIRLGYVIDMFDWCFINFPVFNFADLCITAGAILFMLMILRDYKEEKKAEAEKKNG